MTTLGKMLLSWVSFMLSVNYAECRKQAVILLLYWVSLCWMSWRPSTKSYWVLHYKIQHNDTQQNDIQHGDSQHNDTQHWSKLKTTLSMMTLGKMLLSWVSFMLSVNYAECRKQAHWAECCYAECRYTVCRYAECRGDLLLTLTGSYTIKLFTTVIYAVPW